MESINKLKEIDIKNRTCYYFGDIIKIEDFDFDNFLIDQKSYKNILVYSISYKSLIAAKPLRIGFDKIDRLIRVYDGTRYLVLFGSKKYDPIYIRIRYLISVKSGITYIVYIYILLHKTSFCIKYKYYIMIELMLLKELKLIKKVHQKSAIFATIGIF